MRTLPRARENDVLHDAKTYAASSTCGLGSEKRLKNLVKILQGDTAAVVRELQLNMLIFYSTTDN